MRADKNLEEILKVLNGDFRMALTYICDWEVTLKTKIYSKGIYLGKAVFV